MYMYMHIYIYNLHIYIYVLIYVCIQPRGRLRKKQGQLYVKLRCGFQKGSGFRGFGARVRSLRISVLGLQ